MLFSNLQKLKLINFIVVFVIAIGMLFPAGAVVVAQDVPPVTGTEEAPVVEEPPAEEPTAEPPADPPAEPPAEETPVPEDTAEPTTEPVIDPTVEVTEEAPVDPTVEPTLEETGEAPVPTEAPVETPAEIIAAAADNGVTLVDEEGNPLVMADEETSELLETGDPYYISVYGTRDLLNNGWATRPVYEAWVEPGGSCIPSNSSRTVNCHYDANPIQAAIIAAPAGRVVHIEAGDYTADDLIISRQVIFRTTADIVVNSITLNNGANVSFFTGGNLRTGTWLSVVPYNQSFSGSLTLTSANIFLNEGAFLSDAVELAANGGSIEISAGTFDDETSIDINKSVDIGGQGAATILSPSGVNINGGLLVIQADDVTIHDLTLDGNGNMLTTTGIRDTADHDGLEVYNTTIQDFFTYGIRVEDDGTFNIHDNTFQGMRGIGGITLASGIYVAGDGNAAANQQITNNVFTNNDFGVSILNSNVQLNGNNFTGNTTGVNVTGLLSANTIDMQYNRFFGNTTGLNYTALGTGLPAVVSDMDWWGCNEGPGAAGCDTVSGSLVSVPSYLMFGLSATPTSIFTDETSTLTSFMYSGGDPANVVNNANMPWFVPPTAVMTGTSYGSLVGSIFTAGGVTGTQYFSAMFDNATATATVDVQGDVDGDGVVNEEDNCVDVANSDQVDTDGDGEGDACDATPNGDNDEDGIDNLEDNCVDTYNPYQEDNDEDGIGNVCDATPNGDWDEDGIDDEEDNCPETWNPEQEDSDDDGQGDACDPFPFGDQDEDGIGDPDDNCPTVWNYDQLDSDEDGQGDVCDSTPFGDPFTPPGGGGDPVLPFGGLIPVTGGLMGLSCTEAASLSLPSGDNVTFSDPLCEFEAAFSQEGQESLPGPIPGGFKFISAVNLLLQKGDTNFSVLPEPVTFTLTFVVPEEYKGKTLTLLTWDASLNGGLGGWASTPVEVSEDGLAVIENLNFTGLFVLVFGG